MSTIHGIDNAKNSDQRQTPRSDKKPEINITYHKLRQSSKKDDSINNPFNDKQIQEQQYLNTSENQSPSKQQQQQNYQQQHYSTASFKEENNNDNGGSCMPICGGGQYQSNYNLYNEHVCDEDCVHDEDYDYNQINDNSSTKKKSKIQTNNSSPASRCYSPSYNPHQITQNLKVSQMSRTPRDTSITKSKIAINTLNAKLLTTHQQQTSSHTPGKYTSTPNTINNMNMNMGFHTTSSKQMVNASNNYTQSSMYVKPFHNEDDEDNDEEESTSFIYGSIKNSSTLQSNQKIGRVENNNNNNSNILYNKMQNSMKHQFMSNNNDRSQERRNQSQNSGQKDSQKQKGLASNIFQDKIQKIQQLQQRVIQNGKANQNEFSQKQMMMKEQFSSKKTSSITPKFDKSKTTISQDEDLIETGDDYVETDRIPINQHDNDIQGQLTGNYFSQIDKNYQNSHHVNNQMSPLFQNSESLHDKLAFKVKQHLQNGQNTSLYSTQSGFFNKQKDDQYLGSLNNFVDAKIQTLHVMIQEKRKIQLILEEKQMQLKQLKQDKLNQLKQEEIFLKEIALCEQRQFNLNESNKDLEFQISLVSEKIIEKSCEYQTQFGDYEHQMGRECQKFQELEKTHIQEAQKEQSQKEKMEQDIQNLKLYNKEADDILKEMKIQTDHKGNNEKNRVQFMRNKGNDVLKVIQDDKIYSERPNARSKSPSQIKQNLTPNNRSNNQNVLKQMESVRSTSQIGIKNAKQQQISQQLQTYMQQKVNKQKNFNISLISLNQADDSCINYNNTVIIQDQDNRQNINNSISRTRDKSANLKERDQNIIIRKASEQVLSSSKSSKDFHKYQIQNQSVLSKPKEEKKSQYFEKSVNKVNENQQCKTQQQSTVKINLHTETLDTKQDTLTIQLTKNKNNSQLKSQQGYQSSHQTSSNKDNKNSNLKGDIKATYATVNLF